GWYERYLAAFLDGGDYATAGAHLVPQRLFYPTSIPATLPSGAVEVRPGGRGDGFDLVEARRGEAGYSPLCQAFAYDPPDPSRLPTSVDEASALPHTPMGLVYCFQVTP